MAGLGCLGLLAALLGACATGGTGPRDEGPANSDPVARATPTTSPSASPAPVLRRKEAVALVKADPAVDDDVKRDLKPCVGHEYPVDVSNGTLTDGTAPDVVINVMTCGDAVGIGTYVYRAGGKSKLRAAGRGYENVFKAEDPPVYSEIDRGDLVVTKQVYEKGDPVSYPSGEEVITYRWLDHAFKEQDRTRNDYSKAVGGDKPSASED
ncbi:hypothetical protein [Streptomyces tsukubensis]|uniref:hypothetical protein n=1 Tax=Streptomyces tsukubensis TaxID=83656 RepID=UPI000D1C8212|nr:hypothetical protein GBW32_21180 [Streptomyces tsukubensis]